MPGKYRHILCQGKCEIVISLARELAIELVYLPPYSPNLNLIEGQWKFTKGKLRVKYYADFTTFKGDAIDSIINETVINPPAGAGETNRCQRRCLE